MPRPFPTSADVRQAYSPDKAWDERHNQWVVFFLVRPLSQRLTPALVRAGISANMVTLAGLIVSLALPALAVLPWGGVAIATACLVFLLLDCLDGDVARVGDGPSRLGGYLDMVTGIAHPLLLYVAIGLATVAGGGPAWTPLVGAFAAWLTLAARWCRASLVEQKRDDPYARHKHADLKPFDYVFFFFAGLDQLLPAFIAAAAIRERMIWLVWGVLAYSVLDFVFTQVEAWRALK